MKDFSRIIPKQGHEDWMAKLSKIGSARAIIDAALAGEIDGLDGPVRYSDYHGVGQLDTPYFVVVIGTFPVLTEAAVVERS